MRLLAVAIWLCISAVPAAQAVPTCSACVVVKPAPAPVIGAGIPALLVVGGLLLGTKFLAHRRRS